MNALTSSLLIFLAASGGAVAGVLLQRVVPAHHRRLASKETIKVSIGLVATMAAVVVGFMVSSAKDSYELKRGQLSQIGAMVMHLDRVLALYGPDAGKSRDVLRHVVEETIAGFDQGTEHDILNRRAILIEVYTAISALGPANEDQRILKTAALQLCLDIGQERWLLVEERAGFVEVAYVWILAVWIVFIFVGFGLFAPSNYTVLIAFGLSAFSVSCAIFLILELDQPFSGLLRISPEPLKYALKYLGK